MSASSSSRARTGRRAHSAWRTASPRRRGLRDAGLFHGKRRIARQHSRHDNQLLYNQTDLKAVASTGGIEHTLDFGVSISRETYDARTGNSQRAANGTVPVIPLINIANPNIVVQGPANAGRLWQQCLYRPGQLPRQRGQSQHRRELCRLSVRHDEADQAHRVQRRRALGAEHRQLSVGRHRDRRRPDLRARSRAIRPYRTRTACSPIASAWSTSRSTT